MIFKTLTGTTKDINPNKYKIVWGGGSLSNFQYSVKQFLKPYWKGNLVYEEFPVVGTRLRIDILNLTKRVAIEVQGFSHTDSKAFYHDTPMSYFQQCQRDTMKRQWCNLNSTKLVEIFPEDLPLNEDFFKKLGVLL